MGGAGKTLTVSYGSFSCTLEGFEDPVAVLVSVTRHLHSLSHPDLPFAAQGPVPDPDLLLRGAQAEPSPAPPPPAAAAADPAPAPRRADIATDRDADVSRLLSQTIGQMEGAEQRRRLATLGHLKAAVAATEDDPGAGQGGDPARERRFRDDLADAMRPGHLPNPGLPPLPERATPLLLVPELRLPVTSAHEPYDARQPLPEPQKAAIPPSFADFADRLGAVRLPDLMEAAAAFAIVVDGASGFTRPELMRQLAALPGQRGGTPEDQMRAFGMLLRQGRFMRVHGGSFALPDDAVILSRARALTG